MTVPQLVVLLRALLGAAEELEAEAESRAADRDGSRAAQTEADAATVAEIVAAHPDITAGELRAALVATGISPARAGIAIPAAVHVGRIIAAPGPGSTVRYHLPEGAP